MGEWWWCGGGGAEDSLSAMAEEATGKEIGGCFQLWLIWWFHGVTLLQGTKMIDVEDEEGFLFDQFVLCTPLSYCINWYIYIF